MRSSVVDLVVEVEQLTFKKLQRNAKLWNRWTTPICFGDLEFGRPI